MKIALALILLLILGMTQQVPQISFKSFRQPENDLDASAY